MNSKYMSLTLSIICVLQFAIVYHLQLRVDDLQKDIVVRDNLTYSYKLEIERLKETRDSCEVK